MVAEGVPRPLVLVVDDYEDAREMYAECLDASGFEVAQAESGDEAVAKAVALQPALIVMDLALPGMDGWSATRAIKTDARTAAIPVVALTGHARSDASTGGARCRLRRLPHQALPARRDRRDRPTAARVQRPN